MNIGLIDVDGHNYPNIPLMKISAWHKNQGDNVKWYEPLFDSVNKPLDRVYMSKVFSFTPDYPYFINAKEILKGGSGYAISLVEGVETYDKEKDVNLPQEIEHIYPDYSLYPEQTKDTAYGFLTRGCPRGCDFCHVANKEGRGSVKVADLSEFWQGQKNIILCDPNILACKDWKELLQQLIESKSKVDFNQGLDIRLMTDDKIEMLNQINSPVFHFAWDNYEDKSVIVSKLKAFKEITGKPHRNLQVFMLTNFNTTIEQDFDRIYTLRDIGFNPYLMIYDKEHIPKKHILRKMQRWVNNRYIWETTPRFEDYKRA